MLKGIIEAIACCIASQHNVAQIAYSLSMQERSEHKVSLLAFLQPHGLIRAFLRRDISGLGTLNHRVTGKIW